jgi:hypothetical protein
VQGRDCEWAEEGCDAPAIGESVLGRGRVLTQLSTQDLAFPGLSIHSALSAPVYLQHCCCMHPTLHHDSCHPPAPVCPTLLPHHPIALGPHLACPLLLPAAPFQDEPVYKQLQQLAALLRLEWERAQASPAMRLLDDVLELLGEDRGGPDYAQRQADVATRLRDAFTGGEPKRGRASGAVRASTCARRGVCLGLDSATRCACGIHVCCLR